MRDRRHEGRTPVEIPVRIWGVDARGARYSQNASARNVSLGGALICGIDYGLRPGDLIGIQHGASQARYRVVWSRDSGGPNKHQAAVQKLQGNDCPWKEYLSGLVAVAGPIQAE